MCDVKRDLRIPPFCKLPHFSDSSLHWSVKYFMHGRKTFMTRHSVHDSEAFRPNYFAHAGCYSPIQVPCFCCPLRLETPCARNYYSCHLSSRRDDLRLSCLLTQALRPLESIADLNHSMQLFFLLHYILC